MWFNRRQEKTIAMKVMGTMFLGIHLIVHPLLALTADQVLLFMEGNESNGVIEVHNMDEHAARSKHVRKRIMLRMLGMKRSTSSTLFMLCLPQFMALHDDFVHALLQCGRCRTLRSVCIDKAHLFAQQRCRCSALRLR